MPLTNTEHIQTQPTPEAQSKAGLLSYKQLITAGLDLLYPPRCAGCDRVDTYWCTKCQADVQQLIADEPGRMESLPPLRAILPTGPHEGKLRQAIHALKFENCTQIAPILGQIMAHKLDATNWRIDIVVPVPLHSKREGERGYNQSQLLAESIKQARNMTLVEEAIQRQLSTRPQVGLNAQERRDNMQNAFRADPERVRGKNILLIDDVYTTGATLAACAAAALDAGAREIYGLTLSRA